MPVDNMDDLELALKVLWKAWGTPYRWGGDDPMAGFDCSGLMNEALYSCGLLPFGVDLTAQAHFQRWPVATTPEPGMLCFWGKSPMQIHHVEMMVSTKCSIGAGGGGSKTLTLGDAIASNAYVRVRPLKGREAGFMGFRDPFA